ncbi:hypothetical protein SlGVgp021 [Spodoptera litura granulovirus]|uniref:Uncharacterized protein n=1 Tax=Spodoptera litura granulovirus TaxID=359919 RepID=A5IZM3_9BBAC|nr:hypothetical protein SlGVgp021 [Spodoptera litura granulovirus]ABQ51964.1 hypothetical protein SlGVgp021 [Spodoptera litura granulovirus]
MDTGSQVRYTEALTNNFSIKRLTLLMSMQKIDDIISSLKVSKMLYIIFYGFIIDTNV